MLFPPPPGVDVTRSEDLARLMDVMPLAAKLFVVFAWFLGALVGGIVALSIGRRPLFAWIIGAALVALSVLTTMTFPHPLWMVIAAIVLPVLAAFLAIRLARLPAMP
jgi:predicted outer membrane lipoprotein